MGQADLSEFTLQPHVSIEEGMRRIDRLGTGLVIIVNEADELIGTVADGDIRRSIVSGLDLDAPLSAVMNEDPIRINVVWTQPEIKQYLEESGAKDRIPDHRMIIAPVVDGDDRLCDVAYLSHSGEMKQCIVGDGNDQSSASGDASSESVNGVDSVLVIGGAGYIGSVLCHRLLANGYSVRVLDKLIYGEEALSEIIAHDRFELLHGDMRSIEAITEAIQGVDAVVHLGAIVGDPASAIDAQKTLEMNYHAVRLAASVCKYHQVNRFLFASTCSVYGKSHSPETRLTEEATTNPVSLYGKTKLDSEQAVLEMEDENFSPTVFRMATIYGLSPRMRFDLVVNILSAKAYEEGVIPIFGGDQYRPLVHVEDAAQAYIDCLETPISTVSGEVYNIGSNEQNYPIIDVGEKVQTAFPTAEIDQHPEKEDERTYQVDFSKAQEQLNFNAEWTIEESAQNIKDAFEGGRFQDYTAKKYSNYRTLQSSEQVFSVGETVTRVTEVKQTPSTD